ncbi:helix-turn-helix domain-containing protein [Mucilaginibacter sp.]
MIHVGQNIARIRGVNRFTQKQMADKLNLTQPEYSRIEQKEQIDDGLLERIASVLEVTPDTIKNLSDDGKVNILSSSLHDSPGSFSHYPVFNFNPLDKVIELYERIIKEKDELLRQKDEIIEQKGEVIEMYKKQPKAS